jgi:5,10-methenyltetrahydrofolate synthetase
LGGIDEEREHSTVTTDSLPQNDADRVFRNSLRRDMIARRMALPAARHAALSAAVRDRLAAVFSELAGDGSGNKSGNKSGNSSGNGSGQVVGFCWPVQNEPDLRPFIAGLIAAGCRAVLPVVLRPGVPLAFREWWPEQPLVPDRYGIPTPTDGDFLHPAILLLPVNAFDAGNHRLGYGGGFFDRTLAALAPRPLAIGVGFDFQRVASIRPAAHDLPLDAVVTESGCQRIR